MLKTKNKHNDAELVELFNAGQKEKAFNQIVSKYQERLYWHIRKIVISHDDADDALQNTFIKTWKGLENFRSDSQLFTWLYRIATNEGLSLLKSKKKTDIGSTGRR
jgi:RNA polymerase sigma factor (sigma-70 family)